MQSDMAFGQARAQTINLYVDNVHHLGAGDLVEHYHFVNTVDELGSEAFLTQSLSYYALNLIFIHTIELVQPCGSHITCHNDDCIFEIDCTALAICQAAIVENL